MADGTACLIVAPAWVGDMVMAQGLFQVLREHEPETSIDVMAPPWTAPLARRMPEVRAAIEVPLRHGRLDLARRWRQARALRNRYGRAIVLPNTFKSALIPWLAGIPRRTGYLGEYRYRLINDVRPLSDDLKRRAASKFQALGGDGAPRRPRLAVDRDNQRVLCARWSLAPGRFAALAPGAEFGPSKRWPAERFAEVARRFAAEGRRVVVVGSSGEAPLGKAIAAAAPDTLNLCGETRLDDAVDLLAAAWLVVTNDSGLMHIAAAVSAPTVAIFGSSSAEHTPPLSPFAVTVSAGVPCSPCFQRTCPYGHTDCMNTLDVEMVLDSGRRAVGMAGNRPTGSVA